MVPDRVEARWVHCPSSSCVCHVQVVGGAGKIHRLARFDVD